MLIGKLTDWLDNDRFAARRRLRIGWRSFHRARKPPERLPRGGDARAPYLMRRVNRSDAVRQVVVNGRLAYDQGRFAEDLGQVIGYGRFRPSPES